MSRFGTITLVACAFALPAFAQDNGISDDLQTGIDQILIEPLDESDIGFGGGLSFESLQDFPDNGSDFGLADITTETSVSVRSGTGAKLRALDKLTGEVKDMTIASGQVSEFGRISVYLADCRYPEGNASGDAYAYVTVSVAGADTPVFTGWMVASSPALNAMDHARYDLWALSCSTS